MLCLLCLLTWPTHTVGVDDDGCLSVEGLAFLGLFKFAVVNYVQMLPRYGASFVFQMTKIKFWWSHVGGCCSFSLSFRHV